jgi:hypothetical protein
MKNILLILFTIYNVTSFAQEYTFQCDTLKIGYYNAIMENSDPVYRCPTNQIDTNQIPAYFLERTRNYLIKRVGSEFYTTLAFEDARTIDTNSWRLELPWVDKRIARKLKYSFRYSFMVQDSMKYFFSVVLDQKGRRISKHHLPSLKNIKNFTKKVDACKAVSIANRDSVFIGQAYRIDFEYSERYNCFIWAAYKPSIKIDDDNIILIKILINSNTGKINGRQQLKARVLKPSQL